MVFGVAPDFCNYADGAITCNADKKKIGLGFTVSKEFKYLMEGNCFTVSLKFIRF